MKKISSLTEIVSLAAYLQRIGAEPRSLRTAVVKEMHGAYWKDIAVIRVNKDGTIQAPDAFAPTESEATLIKSECESVEWPELVKGYGKVLPDQLKSVPVKDLFFFRDEEDRVIMIQQRIEDGEGGKAYVPWTFWSDSQWRRMEPEGKLPLWGIDQLKRHAVVFIHEGAKAARAMAEMVNGTTRDKLEMLKQHPWGDELKHAAHLGWIGGALSPFRTDWSALKRAGVKKAYIVSDNDEAGLSAVASISQQLRMPTFHLQFTGEWPASFDMADEWPAHMFKEINGTRHYVGPPFRTCIHPATWATDLIPNPKGKPTVVLREEFKDQWAYVEEVDMFVCKDMPEIIRSESVMNKMLAAFSHSNNTSSLMVASYRGRKTRLAYRPDLKSRVISDRTTSAINLHTPTTVKSVIGDPQPWLDFLEYLVPDPKERHNLARWCATLIARPEIRMEYGVLLVSEEQGVGKTTLAARILAPLVGDQNTGFPAESEIVDSSFNSWLANKRLIIVSEIYSGHSWKAYNTLKGYITDKEIQVNEKYMRPYRIENWAHMLASSNSRKALKMEENDRRWYYPEVTEVKWPREKFVELHEWLASGGLGIIKHWAEKFGDYVTAGEAAPMTRMKRQMIEDSRSEAAQELADFCDAVVGDNEAAVFAMKEVVEWLRTRQQGRMFDSDYDLRKLMVEKGFHVFGKRIKIGSRMQYVVASPEWVDRNRSEWVGMTDECVVRIRASLKSPIEMTQGDM